MKYKAVLFDLDGTLLNTLEDLRDSVNYVMETYGYPKHSLDAIRGYVGNGIRKLMERATPDGAANPKFEEGFALFQEYYLTHNQVKTRPYDGIMDVLRQLKAAHVPMAIVTNKNQPTVDVLREDVFEGLLDVAVGDDGVRPCKPDPAPVEEAIRRLGFDPADESLRQKMLYIGDSDVDAATGANAKTKLCLCTWGFRDKDFLQTFDYDAMIDAPEELLDIILEEES